MLNIREPFFYRLVDPLVEQMGEAYPILAERQSYVEQTLRTEEERFGETLAQGMVLLENRIKKMSGATIPGDVVFQLYDTYGFPADLTADVAREKGLSIDMAGFDEAMAAQRARGRASASFSTALGQRVTVSQDVTFQGYTQLGGSGRVLGVFDSNGDAVSALEAGMQGVVVLDQTPFYAESGGQVGDRGQLLGRDVEFDVQDTQPAGVQSMHIGCVLRGSIAQGDQLETRVAADRRAAVRRNHSATHLLHAALREVLGGHVQQKGSLVNDEKLRFDFSHEAPVTPDQIQDLEDKVNAQILANTPVNTEMMAFDDAVAHGAMALFGEKYGDEVRVLSMGDGYSVELCGGTHVSRTGDIGFFKITSETGIAAGIRRLEAVTGFGAITEVRRQEAILAHAGAILKSATGDLGGRIEGLLKEHRAQAKEIEALTARLAAKEGSGLLDQATAIGDAEFLGAVVDGDGKALMQTLDTLKSRLKRAVIVLVNRQGDKANMVVSVAQDLTARLTAPELLNHAGSCISLKGGGRPDLARGGGGDGAGDLAAALQAARALAEERFG